MVKKHIPIILVIILIIAGGLWFIFSFKEGNESLFLGSASPDVRATYVCDGNKGIFAEFYKGEAEISEPGEPPVLTGKVKLTLSDGRKMELPQAISASGARYANEDESFVFWDKGGDALVLENGFEKDYTGCSVAKSFKNEHQEKAIINYILTQNHFSWKTTNDSHAFCSIENLEPENEFFPFHIWAYCGEYALENGELKTLSGSSGPAKIDYPNELSFYDISRFSYEVPRNGAYYGEDVKSIFPKKLHQDILAFSSGDIIKSIIARNESVALNSIILWEDIKEAIKNCEVESIFQSHDRSVKVKLKNEEVIESVEPEIDVIIDLAVSNEAECGKIIISTE